MDEPVEFEMTEPPPYRLWVRAGVACKRVLAALHMRGDMLKESRKSSTWRVGDWVVKRNRQGFLKLTLFRERYRRAWRAAVFLERRGVLVPTPVAWAERRRFGLVIDNAFVSAWLEGCVNVEAYARTLKAGNPGPETVAAFFEKLAAAVNHLNATGAYHSDLSGKNIFTRYGVSFYFIDLDGVVLGRRYSPAMRLKNHVQIYDSFCDLFDDGALRPFIMAMAGPEAADNHWFDRVKDGQARRREKHRKNAE